MSRYKAYPAYRDSGVEWLGDIPPHWLTSKLRYGFSFGKGLSITKENLVDEGIPCVNYGEVHSKFGFEVDPGRHALKCVDVGYLKSSGESLIKNGDFVFADTSEDIEGSGNFTQLRSDAITFAGYHTIIARPNNRKSARYFAYLFDSKPFRTQIRHAVKGVKVFSITQAILRGADIWLPSQDEQEKIAAFLDHETAKIDALIEKQQRLIELLKEKRQAVISHAVTKGLNPNAPMQDSGVEWLGEIPAHWDLTRLGWICSEINDINHVMPAAVENGIPFLSAKDLLDDGTLNFTNDIKMISEDDFANLSKKICPRRGDIIYSRIGACLGKARLVETDVRFLISYSCCVVRVTPERASRRFIQHLLDGEMILTEARIRTQGIGVPDLGLGEIGRFPVPLPPIAEQERIADYLDRRETQLSCLAAEAQRAVVLLQERRTALISAAVTGKIDVRDWQPAAA